MRALWSDRQNCSHNVSQKVKRIRRFSECFKAKPIKKEHVNRSLGNGVRKNGVRNRVRIDDVGSILKFRIGLPFGENSTGFCQSVWRLGSILNFRIGSVSSIGGLIAVTLFADTVSDPQHVKEFGGR